MNTSRKELLEKMQVFALSFSQFKKAFEESLPRDKRLFEKNYPFSKPIKDVGIAEWLESVQETFLLDLSKVKDAYREVTKHIDLEYEYLLLGLKENVEIWDGENQEPSVYLVHNSGLEVIPLHVNAHFKTIICIDAEVYRQNGGDSDVTLEYHIREFSTESKIYLLEYLVPLI